MSELFEAFRPDREISDAAIRALDAGIPVKTRKGVQYVYVNDATAEYLFGKPEPYPAPLLCTCSQRPHPHDLSVHNLLRYECGPRDQRFRWPWSLMLSQREEPSTERKVAA